LKYYDTQAAFYAHASAGCLHIRPIINLKTEAGTQHLRGIAQDVLQLTLSLGGAMSSEHGDGLVRAEWLKETYGEQIVAAMKGLKQAADPESLLNPNKMIDAPKMDANLRYGNGYQTEPWKPGLDFTRQGGLTGAIEQCNGQGVCRKQDGVMCPSFQATRDEIYSTRGRANLLRAMISVGRNGLSEDQVRQAMDLCLACKGCKAECPSGVDMAKLKYEFQAHYYEKKPRRLRDYLFGYIGVFASLGAPFGGLINWIMNISLARNFADRFLGISRARAFPKFGKSVQRKKRYINSERKESCLFLPDTFTHFFEPEIERAALDVLEACGVQVIKLPVFGAGRTLLSKGFLEPARQQAEHVLTEIRRADPTGQMAVIGLEPSEIYMLRDDITGLLPDKVEELQDLAARAWLIDEYLIRPDTKDSKMRIANAVKKDNFKPQEKILLHAHCYQKAQSPNADGYATGANASVELMRAVGYEVDILATGCCGMAGAFGYESEHLDLSLQVGELKLFPEIRERMEAGLSQVAAIGTSCRSQIADGTGVNARHSIMYIADRLKS